MISPNTNDPFNKKANLGGAMKDAELFNQKQKDTKKRNLEISLRNKKTALDRIKIAFKTRSADLDGVKRDITSLKTYIQSKKQEKQREESNLKVATVRTYSDSKKISGENQKLLTMKSDLERISSEIENLQREINRKKTEETKLKSDIQSLFQVLEREKVANSSSDASSKDKEKTLQTIDSDLKEKENRLKAAEQKIILLEREVKTLETTISNSEREISSLEAEIRKI